MVSTNFTCFCCILGKQVSLHAEQPKKRSRSSLPGSIPSSRSVVQQVAEPRCTTPSTLMQPVRRLLLGARICKQHLAIPKNLPMPFLLRGINLSKLPPATVRWANKIMAHPAVIETRFGADPLKLRFHFISSYVSNVSVALCPDVSRCFQ